jgi:hypothetical protein
MLRQKPSIRFPLALLFAECWAQFIATYAYWIRPSVSSMKFRMGNVRGETIDLDPSRILPDTFVLRF